MKVEMLVIAQHPEGLQEEIVSHDVGSPRHLAKLIATVHAELQADCNAGILSHYTLLTEFDSDGRVR